MPRWWVSARESVGPLPWDQVPGKRLRPAHDADDSAVEQRRHRPVAPSCRITAARPAPCFPVRIPRSRGPGWQEIEAFPDGWIEFVANTYNASLREVKPAGGRMNVLFLPGALFALVWRLREGANAKNVYEKTSRLKDQLGQQVLSEKLTVVNEPLNDQVPGARAFDDEGIPCRNLALFEAGMLKSFYCDLDYGRKLGIPPTGNGFRGDTTTKPVPALEHLTIQPGDKSLGELIGMMKRGLIVGGAMGAHSGNILNGDYSIGLAPGIYVENGGIAGRVKDAMAPATSTRR